MAQRIILGVGAHPDDMDFMASGTIAKLVEEGWEAYYLVCTDGSRGSRQHETTHEQLKKTRQEEQQEAGRIIGLKDIFFLDNEDTQLMCDPDFKEQIVKVIRTIKPNVVITMDPTFYFSPISPWNDNWSLVNHTDHRAAGLATMDAVFPLARDRLSFPEHEAQGIKTHRVDELWFTSFDKKDHVVDITSTFQKKLKALFAHKSQIDDHQKLEHKIRSHAAFFAQGEDFEFAESFTRLKLE